MTEPSWRITPLDADDIEAAVAIDRQSPSPWTFAQLEGELYRPASWRLAGRERGSNTLAGFLLARNIAGEAEILRLGVDECCKRQGLATALLNSFFSTLEKEHISKCYLELRANNHAARCLYEKSDFVMTGLRKKYYTDPTDDAVNMMRTISTP